MRRSLSVRSGGILALALFAAGCAPPVETAYVASDDLGKLPEKHRTQINEALGAYFGTPNYPRFMQPVPEEKQPADAKSPLLEDTLDRNQLRHGREVYVRQCAGCHGSSGDGRGPAAVYLNPPPRDYRLGKFKFISAPRGSKPRREDLARIIRRGAKGTSMPAFRWMAQDDLDAVIDYVRLLSSRGELEYRTSKEAEFELDETDDLDPAAVAEIAHTIESSWKEADAQTILPLTPRTPRSPENSAEGAKAFVKLNCYKCHGRDGRGNPAQNVGKDDWGRIAFAADLTTGTLHGGRRPIDIYRRIYAGINATPMPAFGAPDSSQGETVEQRSATIWNLTHFIADIVEGKPLPFDVIDAAIAEQLKNSPDAQAPAEAKPEATKPEENESAIP